MEYTNESFIGSGDLRIAQIASGARQGARPVGHASAFSIESPKIEKKTMTSKMRATYGLTHAEQVTKVEQEIKFSLTDFSRKNLSMAMWGQDMTVSQSAGDNIGAPESVTVYLDAYVDLSHRRLDPATPAVVTDETATTTYTAGEDYEIDYLAGTIAALSGGAIAEGDTVLVESAWLAYEGWEIEANAVTQFPAYLELLSRNEFTGKDFVLKVFQANLQLSGGIEMLTDDFGKLDFTGSIISTDDGTWKIISL